MYNYYILITQQMLQTFWPNTSAYAPACQHYWKQSFVSDLHKPFPSREPTTLKLLVSLSATTWNCYQCSRLKRRISGAFSQDWGLWVRYLDPLLQYEFICV